MATVAAYWHPIDGWDLTSLVGLLPKQVLLTLTTYMLAPTGDEIDVRRWSLNSSGIFLVKSIRGLMPSRCQSLVQLNVIWNWSKLLIYARSQSTYLVFYLCE